MLLHVIRGEASAMSARHVRINDAGRSTWKGGVVNAIYGQEHRVPTWRGYGRCVLKGRCTLVIYDLPILIQQNVQLNSRKCFIKLKEVKESHQICSRQMSVTSPVSADEMQGGMRQKLSIL